LIFVLDACALIAFLRREPGADLVRDLLRDPNNACQVHAINLCEVYYDIVRVAGEATAQASLTDLNSVGLIVREDMDSHFWQAAGKLKARGRLSLADCFAVPLTNRVGGELVTSDHREFDPVAAGDICPVRFFR
jgi:PIN domain nuclease of toxin-antitoxin system